MQSFFDGPITQKTLDDITKGFPKYAQPKDFALYEEKENGASFGTFRAILRDEDIYHVPDFINVLKKSTALTSGAVRNYVGCIVRVEEKKIIIGQSKDPNNPLHVEIVGKFQLKEGMSPTSQNFFFIAEIDMPDQLISIGREVKEEVGEKVTYVILGKGNLRAVLEN